MKFPFSSRLTQKSGVSSREKKTSAPKRRSGTLETNSEVSGFFSFAWIQLSDDVITGTDRRLSGIVFPSVKMSSVECHRVVIFEGDCDPNVNTLISSYEVERSFSFSAILSVMKEVSLPVSIMAVSDDVFSGSSP